MGSLRALPLVFLGVVCVAAPAAAQEQESEVRPAFRAEPARPLSRFSPQQVLLLEKLNRADRRHLARLDRIVVPDRWDLPETAYSPLPAYSEWAAPFPKALIVDLPGQAFAGYENGRLVRWGPISSGKEATRTPSGDFHLTWRSRSRRSSIDQSWLLEWYFNFHNTRGIAFHQYEMPGGPASHACLRLLRRDAMWLYGWGEGWTLGRGGEVIRRGTPVRIVGQYDFAARRPWLETEWWAQGVAPAPGEVSQR